MIKISRRKLKKVYPNHRKASGLSYYVEEKSGRYFLVEKSNLFGKVITILLAPYYVIRDGVSEYRDTVKVVFNFFSENYIPEESYEKLLKGE